MIDRARPLAVFLCICSAIAIAGCVSHSGATATSAHNKVLVVNAPSTPFFRYGPVQGGGPDKQLTKDTLVTLIRSGFGYSKVKLDSGEQGFVATTDLRPAPPQLIAAANNASEAAPEIPPPTLPAAGAPDSGPPLTPEPTPLAPLTEDPSAPSQLRP